MAITHSKEVVPRPDFLIRKLSPRPGQMPAEGYFGEYGVDTLGKGQECDYHFHVYDEYWVFVEGKAKVRCGEETDEVGPGDMVYTPAGTKHQIQALTDTTVVWLVGKLEAHMRLEHLHDEKDA